MFNVIDKVAKSINSLLEKKKVFKPTTDLRKQKKQEAKRDDQVFCSFCGLLNLAANEYCASCNMRINLPPSKMMKLCEKCSSSVNDDSAYCYACGNSFNY